MPIRATMMLCDYAVVADGKLFISGGGWTVTGPDPSPSGIALLLEVPWDRTNTNISFKLTLVHQDGQPVTQMGPLGQPVPVEIGGDLEVGRPPGIRHGTPLPVPLAINIPPLPLAPGARYSWDLIVDGASEANWHLGFETRPVPPGYGDPGAVPPMPPL